MSKRLTKAAVDRLVRQARRVSEHAHSPYSGIRVGAVALAAGGTSFPGCNIENASFGLTQCAERVALGAAVAAGAKPGTVQALVIYSEGFTALSPCGACRQVMAEWLADDAPVFSCSGDGQIESWTMADLLPHRFEL